MNRIQGYQIVEKIEETSGSLIYRAHKDGSSNTVVIKEFKGRFPSVSEIARIKQEYEILRYLDIESTIKIHEIISYENSLALVLEDFNGVSISKILDEVNTLDISSFLSIAIKIANALGEIHKRNIIHRDIKPRNILINREDGKIKITDFGISSFFTDENEIFDANILIGTLTYTSPEQTGRINRLVDYRTDIYSLGVTFYEMLSGSVPFRSNDPTELIYSHIAKNPVVLSEVVPAVPPMLSKIVMKLLNKIPDERYQNAFGLMYDLKLFRERYNLKGEDTSFEIGMKDIPIKYIIPQILTGRDKEYQILVNAFNKLDTGSKEIVMVSGQTGIGKSSFVNEIQKSVMSKRGYYLSGKYDPFRKDVPYSAIIQAIQGLIRQILAESPEHVIAWKKKLFEALGSNGKILTDIIPNLETIIGSQPDIQKVDYVETKNRFEYTCKDFLQVFAAKEHPVVIFLDDLQWADHASLDLLEKMISGRTLEFILVIGAYRNNEIDEYHPLKLLLRNIEQNNFIINKILLNPLNISDVNKIILNFLKCDKKKSMELAELVHKKTNGNPFFINQFIKILYEENTITFDKDLNPQWDMDEIGKMEVTDNVVELLAGMIINLPQDVLDILKICSCIGNRFDLNIIADISGKSVYRVLADLKPAIDQEYITFIDKYYRFHHNRIQETIYSLISDEEKSRLHYTIGKIFLEKTIEEDMRDKIIFITDQWNHGIKNIKDEYEKITVIKLNFKAGQKSKSAAAYASALIYFKNGLNLLTEDNWKTYYELTLQFFNEIIECEFAAGNYNEVERIYKIIDQKARNNIEKTKAVIFMIKLFTYKGDVSNGIKLAIKELKKLGYNELSPNPSKISIFKEIIKYNIRIKNKVKRLIDFPIEKNSVKKAIFQVMDALVQCSAISKSLIGPLVIFKRIEFAIKNKSTLEDISISVGALINVILVILKDFNSAYNLYQLAFKLNEKYHSNYNTGQLYFMYATFVLGWKKHQRECIKYLSEAYKYSYESGNLEYSGYTVINILAKRLLLGNNVDEVNQNLEKYGDFIKNINIKYIYAYYLDIKQFLLWMKGETHNIYSLNSTDYNEEDEWKKRQDIGHENCQFFYYYYKMQTRYFSGQYEKAYEICIELGNFLNLSLVVSNQFEYILYYSLILVELIENKSKNKKKYWKTLLANQKKMKKWADNCKENFLHRYFIICAEIARLKKDFLRAENFYNLAIDSAKENEYVNIEAISNELAAKFYLKRGIVRLARTYMTEARYFYILWGMEIKVRDIEKNYPDLILKDDKINEIIKRSETKHDSSTGTSSEVLDISTVMKASQAISGEVELGKLLVIMMKIAIENAGAEKGLMILENAGKYFVEAEYSTGSENVKVLNSSLLDDHHGLSSSVVNFVIRTKETLILNNASEEGDFIKDPYIQKTNPKSILCAPIINQGKLTGILYLENNLTTGAFTEDRLKILNILSSQMAISIGNAKFYEKLEHTVSERTSELTSANDQLLTEINERKKMEEKIRFLAYYDQLTNLPNRTSFMEKLNSTLNSAKRHNRIFAVMFLDIDNFKRINDSLGHNIGDLLIKEVANRLVKSIRKEDSITHNPLQSLVSMQDTVSRLGGDEFTIILSEINDPKNASKVAERIRREFISPVLLENNKLNITVSIGISIYPYDGDSVDILIKNADVAMYNIKNISKNGFQYYNNSMNKVISEKLNMESTLNKALENNELSMYYQPLIELKAKKIYGVEALIRWQNSEKGNIPPNDFIPIAEETGLIINIGEFVLNEVGTHYGTWRKNNLPEIYISINISPKQLNHIEFSNSIDRFINKYNISPDHLIFEITENSIIHNFEKANKIINSLRVMGIRIALDDFGSGNSSFSVLRKINFDILKLDRSFIMNIPENKQDSTVISSLITIGHSMNLKVIAEGVETENQLQFLETNNCDFVQGYYFSKAVPESELVKMLKQTINSFI